ncbi:MAG: efflux RND transporter permease subunit, partial [Armatimonadota bacterium]|nr:efflux RND transporter permease subunit [Armatimonadota bacterium]
LLADVLLPDKAHAHHTDKDGRFRRFLAKALAFFPSLFDHVVTGYGRLLDFCLRRRVWVLLLLLPLLLGSYLLFKSLQTGFFPEFDEGAFVIDYQMPAGTSLAETDRVCLQVEGLLAKTPEVASWSRLSGARSGSGLELTEPNQGDILVRLNDKRSRAADEVMSDLRSQINATQPAFDVDLIQILQDGIGDIGGSPKPIEVKIYGNDTATLAKLAHQAGDIIGKTPGVVDENDGIVETGPEMVVRVDSGQASRFGLTTNGVTGAATSALRGAIATTLQQGEEGIDVRVRAAPGSAVDATGGLDPQSLPSTPIATASGGTVPLSSIARLQVRPGSPQITRENQQQMVSVTARLEGRDLGSGVKDVQARLGKGLTLPSGYRIEYGGLYASQQESFVQLATVLVLAVLFVSTLLLIQFRSFRQALALFAAAILSLSGVLLGLALTKTPLNISSFTGAIMIVGIVTENGIVLFDFLNHLRRENPTRPLSELVSEAGRLRLRPILMTTIGAILALLPLALGLGAGAAMQKPLAVAVIGGLSVSTVFTLLVAPILYVATESLHWPGKKRPMSSELADDFGDVEKELARH